MRILITNNSTSTETVAGVEIYVARLSAMLLGFEENVKAAVSCPSKLQKILVSSNVDIVCTSYPNNIFKMFLNPVVIWKFRKIMSKHEFDIINVAGSIEHRLARYACTLMRNKPKIVYTVHNTKKVRKSTKRRINKRINRVLAVSNAVKQSLISYGIKVPIDIVYAGVNVDHFSPVHEGSITREQLGIESDDIVLVSTAGTEGLKGWSYLASAIAELPENYKGKIKVLLVGAYPNREMQQKFVDNLGLQELVFFTGFVDDTRDYVSLADIGFVLSTVPEGISMASREMMSMGKPVIVSGHGGLLENVDDKVNGWTCKPKSISSVKRVIMDTVDNKYDIEKMGRQARGKAESAFSIESSAKAVLDSYKRVLYN